MNTLPARGICRPADAPTSPPGISIVIPHLNQPDLLAKCLTCLHEQSFDMRQAEIIVVDNGSAEPPRAVVEAFPGTRLATEATPGPGPARNRGVALARAPVVAFTDSDCLPDRGWVAAILARFAADPGLPVIGGDLRVVIETSGRPNIAEAYDQLYGFRQRLNIGRHRFSATANMAARREVLAAVGPFAGLDTSEDLDWGQRAAALGFPTVFAEEMLVGHPARRSMAALRAQWDRHVTHSYRLWADGSRGRLRWALTIPLIALSPLAELPNVLTSDRVSGGRARALAFAGLVRVRLFRAWRMLLAMVDGAGETRQLRWNPPSPPAPGPRRP
jgi:glycosyltransferase involved in cell wall biosynthesis